MTTTPLPLGYEPPAPVPAGELEAVDVGELVQLCATNPRLFVSEFFPKTARLAHPSYFEEVWRPLLDHSVRYLNLRVFRDGAKTSFLRLFMAYRIAYAMSRLVVFIGKSEDAAVRSVTWIRKAVEFNSRYSGTFGLRPGSKWQGQELEIINTVDGSSIWVLGLGIHGSVRGINWDDYRPDLIVCDDVVDEENAATLEQRKKISELVMGAVVNSLSEVTEAYNAKFVMTQTPLDDDDVSMQAEKSQLFTTVTVPCWTKATMGLPVDEQLSVWPERKPTEELRKRKHDATATGKLHVFHREQEVRITPPEDHPLRNTWLKYYDELPGAFHHVVIFIDPVPPPSPQQIAKNLQGKDYEAFVAVGRLGSDYYLMEYKLSRGHQPNWTRSMFMEMGLRLRPRMFAVETVAYQRTLVSLLQEHMEQTGIYFPIVDFQERRSKYDLIVDEISGPASHGHLYVSREHTDFVGNYLRYPKVPHDDLLNGVAGAIRVLSQLPVADVPLVVPGAVEHDNVEPLQVRLGCP